MQRERAQRTPILMIAGLAALFIWMTVLPVMADGRAGQIQPEKLLYKTTEDAKGRPVELHLHVFKPEGWSAEDQRPAIVFFFGGGWTSGSPQQFFPQSEELAAQGMVAVSAEYRIKSKHGTPPQACVEDGKSAMRYVRANAQKLGIDPERIVASGGSAGGHVAMCTALIKGFDAEGESNQISSKPNLMVLFNPVIDTSAETGYGPKKVGENPRSLSPLHHMSKDQPPSLMLYGDADWMVESARRFEKKSKEFGVECRLIEYKGAKHGFFNSGGYREQKNDEPNYHELTMIEAIVFLQKHRYLEGSDE